MLSTSWNILLVDDEPDVLSVTKLALRNAKVYGIPLTIHTCASKAEALTFLKPYTGMISNLAVAFIDVVMESDDAGLQLCKYIRQESGNNLTQLIIRTGQPGVAPERSVIDKYDINGYLSKTEATEDKLYTYVKCGIKQFYSQVIGATNDSLTNYLIAAEGNRAKFKANMDAFFQLALKHDGVPINNFDTHLSLLVGGQAVVAIGEDAGKIAATHATLASQPGRALSKGKTVASGGKVLISGTTSNGTPYSYVVGSRIDIPFFLLESLQGMLHNVATLYLQSK
jgi:CheY-like chemotaxis protein